MGRAKKALNPHFVTYQEQRDKLKAMITRFEGMVSMHGQKWVDSQVAYYNRRLNELEEVKPKQYI